MMNKRTIFYLVVVVVIAVSSISDKSPVVAFLPLFAYIILILLPVIYKIHDRESFEWGHRFLKGAYLGFTLMTMMFITELASGLIRIEDTTPGIQSILIGGAILQGIVALGEELPFRGYILPDMMRRYGTWNGVFMASLFFSLLHIPSLFMLNISRGNMIIMIFTITIAEILLAICYLYDGLSMSIGFHFTWNFFQYHVYSLRKDFGGILNIISGNELLTGGAFGPEAGLLGMFVVTLALIIVFWWMQSY